MYILGTFPPPHSSRVWPFILLFLSWTFSLVQSSTYLELLTSSCWVTVPNCQRTVIVCWWVCVRTSETPTIYSLGLLSLIIIIITLQTWPSSSPLRPHLLSRRTPYVPDGRHWKRLLVRRPLFLVRNGHDNENRDTNTSLTFSQPQSINVVYCFALATVVRSTSRRQSDTFPNPPIYPDIYVSISIHPTMVNLLYYQGIRRLRSMFVW